MMDYLSMGGHGAYIWPCYIVAALLLLALLVHSITHLNKSRRDLQIIENLQETEEPQSAERQAS